MNFLKTFLILFSANTFAISSIPLNPFDRVQKDPCLPTVQQAVATVQISSTRSLPVLSVELVSAKDDRDYLIKFDGLVGTYRLILDNDPNNRCFFVQQSFEL